MAVVAVVAAVLVVVVAVVISLISWWKSSKVAFLLPLRPTPTNFLSSCFYFPTHHRYPHVTAGVVPITIETRLPLRILRVGYQEYPFLRLYPRRGP